MKVLNFKKFLNKKLKSEFIFNKFIYADNLKINCKKEE